MAWRAHWFQAASGDTEIKYTAQEDRAVVLAALFSREGVLDLVTGSTLLKVTQRTAGANNTVDIGIGKAAIRGDDASDQGTYVVSNTTLSTGLAVPTSGSSARTHQVIIRIKDKLHNGSWTTYTGLPEVLVDTSYATALLVPSAIVLASITVPANQSVITNAMILDQRKPASVGTPDRTGPFTLNPDYYQPQASRTTRYAVNPDGWVSLGGWARFVRTGGANHPNYPVSAFVQNQITTDTLPSEILPADGGFRDFVGLCSTGPVQFSVMPTGHLTFLVWGAQTHVSGSTWLSFDGCGYRL